MGVTAIDHVQLAMPAGEEARAAAFYEGVLGIPQVPKPPHLAVRGGCWFEQPGLKIHLGVEADFRPARKAHPALLVSGLGELVDRLLVAGVVVVSDEPLEGYDRVYVDDPFGNRIELMEPLAVTFDRYDHVEGPFYHGTKYVLEVGDQLVPGHGSNYHEGRTSNNIYFSSILETAVWGAELATALAASGERGHVYVVEPTGPFEDDPNVTNKKFPGNITKSYRTRHPMRIVGELQSWEGHAPEVLNAMLDNIARLREQGLDVIED
jgi:rifampin ADP-ribosylating transferase